MTGSVTCNFCKESSCTCSTDDIVNGKFRVVFCHPESIFTSEKGQKLLDSEEFTSIVKGIFIDECHVFDKW